MCTHVLCVCVCVCVCVVVCCLFLCLCIFRVCVFVSLCICGVCMYMCIKDLRYTHICVWCTQSYYVWLLRLVVCFVAIYTPILDIVLVPIRSTPWCKGCPINIYLGSEGGGRGDKLIEITYSI